MWRSFVRTLFVTLVFASSASADSASDSANRWSVQTLSGDIFVASVGQEDWYSPESGQVLNAPFRIRTGATGSVILARGEDTLLVAPQSRIEIQAAQDSPDDGLMTRILQAIGSLVYQVEKRPRQRFEVHTPYLVSVVKGTTFTISVSESDTAVSLDEGSLEVLSKDGLDRALLKPGELARHGKGMGGIQVSDTTLQRSHWGRWHPGNATLDTAGDRQTQIDVAQLQYVPGVPGHANGQPGTAPDPADTAPGLAGTAPGLAGTAPGLAGTAPGLGGMPPGLMGLTPGLSGTGPGKSGAAPGKNK